MEIKKNIPNNTITRKLVDLDRETVEAARGNSRRYRSSRVGGRMR